MKTKIKKKIRGKNEKEEEKREKNETRNWGGGGRMWEAVRERMKMNIKYSLEIRMKNEGKI